MPIPLDVRQPFFDLRRNGFVVGVVVLVVVVVLSLGENEKSLDREEFVLCTFKIMFQIGFVVLCYVMLCE